MSIKFHCSCGKKLRARDAMAARQVVCPQCGQRLGVPVSGAATRSGFTRPLSVEEYLQHPRNPDTEQDFRPNSAAADAASRLAERYFPESGEPPPPDPSRRKKGRGTLHSWLIGERSRPRSALDFAVRMCQLLVPAAGVRMIGLGVVLAGLVLVTALALPQAQDFLQQQETVKLITLAPVATIPIYLIGQVCAWFLCVLVSEISGHKTDRTWIDFNVKQAFTGFACFALTFLAGPIAPAALAVWFWLHSGDMKVIDWLIVAQLGIVAAGYWLLALVEISMSRWPRLPNPNRVAELALQLGWRTFAAIGTATALAGIHAWVLYWALLHLLVEPGRAIPALLGWGVSVLVTGSLFMRLVGCWCRAVKWDQVQEKEPEEEQELVAVEEGGQ